MIDASFNEYHAQTEHTDDEPASELMRAISEGFGRSAGY